MRVWIVAVALILAAAAYSSAIPGGFVSDDDVQIVRNVQIQDGRLFWRALTSDVWSFAGSGDRTSNYWRPAFVSWLALNYRLFGLWARLGTFCRTPAPLRELRGDHYRIVRADAVQGNRDADAGAGVDLGGVPVFVSRIPRFQRNR